MNDMNVENKIEALLNAGTDLSERKIAEKFETSRSVVRRVKADVQKYTVVEEEAPKASYEEIPNIEKLLKSKNAHKKPSSISVEYFTKTKGNFKKFKNLMSDKSAAYVRDQFLRCINEVSRGH